MAKSDKEYKDNRASLAQMLKQKPQTPTPIQEVRPVATKSTELEVKLNFFVPADLAKQIKVYAAQNDMTIKDVSIAAYRLFFEQMSK